jgi:DNA-binding transcriptional regulator YiaG
MWICTDCSLEYTDEAGERLRHEAICRHLGILSPAEIVAIRERYGLSRRQFAASTHIGLASLSRWESGEGTQNPAMDAYLRLLSRKEVFEMVERSDFGVPRRVQTPSPKTFEFMAKFNSQQRARLAFRAGDFELGRAKATA